MQKTKTITWDGQKFSIRTVVETPTRTLDLSGHPMIAIYGDYIQIGCMRITRKALERLNEYIASIPDGVVMDGLQTQPGDYATNDPNTLVESEPSSPVDLQAVSV